MLIKKNGVQHYIIFIWKSMFNKALAKLIPNKFSQNIYDENTPVTRA
jgi:hypothetical protein